MDKAYTQQILQMAEEVFQACEPRMSEDDMCRIRDGFQFAWNAHKKQVRRTGEPYIIHPISVALIVAKELNLDADTIIAAFLHDVVEDTDTTIEQIEERYGKDVAFLVNVVTKKKKKSYQTSKQVDNFRQMLNSLQYDIRALLIKLADRLHNMRTLDSMPPDKQMKIAGETDFFYAPLANRLGLHGIKTELENLSMQYRCPREYAKLEELIKYDIQFNEKLLNTFVNKIEDLLYLNGIEAEVSVRYRRPYSLRKKMEIEHTDFHHLTGRHYIRIIFNCRTNKRFRFHTVSHSEEKALCLRIYSVLTDAFMEKPGSTNNYIDSPKENGYQSFHVRLLADMGIWEEVHISSRRMVENSRLGCMAEREEDNISNWMQKLKNMLKDMSQRREDTFMEDVRSSFYSDDVQVFTPTKLPVVLPLGATAIDFAFEVHTAIGKHAKCARINGKLCSMKTVLRPGDVIEIEMGEKVAIQPDWMNHTVAYKAKQALKQYFRDAEENHKKRMVRCKHCNPMPGDEVIGFVGEDGITTIHKRDCSEGIMLASQWGDRIKSVDFHEDPEVSYPVTISVLGVDRKHFIVDVIDCISNKLQLNISKLSTQAVDNIAEFTISFYVHSVQQLEEVMRSIRGIRGVDDVEEVSRS